MPRNGLTIGLALVLGAGMAAPAMAASGFCSQTARTVFRACGFEVQDDYWIAVAKCINVSGDAEREACLALAGAERGDSAELCRQQLAGRLENCESVGEARYDPDFDPILFDDPRNPSNPNPYFPLKIGNRWEYAGGSEFNTVEVLDQTKLIAGVNCLVVNDVVTEDGDPVEDTDDWFAIAKDASVWYCGEEVKDFQTFDGDDPQKPELVSIDGSFKAGVNGDKPGVIFQASPTRGATYVEEFSLGNAEDVTDILSTTYAYGGEPELDRLVPQPLAQLLCPGDCVVTRNFSMLEPHVSARKYYARGIGFFLEINLETD